MAIADYLVYGAHTETYTASTTPPDVLGQLLFSGLSADYLLSYWQSAWAMYQALGRTEAQFRADYNAAGGFLSAATYPNSPCYILGSTMSIPAAAGDLIAVNAGTPDSLYQLPSSGTFAAALRGVRTDGAAISNSPVVGGQTVYSLSAPTQGFKLRVVPANASLASSVAYAATFSGWVSGVKPGQDSALLDFILGISPAPAPTPNGNLDSFGLISRVPLNNYGFTRDFIGAIKRHA